MTRAGVELLSPRSPENVDSVDKLSFEIRDKAEEMRTRDVTPEEVRALARSVKRLLEAEAPENPDDASYRPSAQMLFPAAEAAAATQDPELLNIAENVINKIYPVDSSVPEDIRELNNKSRREFHTAINTTSRNRDFARALSRAEALTDKRFGEDYDAVLDLSALLVKEQDGDITEEEQRDLDRHREARRRKEEHEKLHRELVARGIAKDEELPDKDAVKVDMSAFLDDKDEAA